MICYPCEFKTISEVTDHIILWYLMVCSCGHEPDDCCWHHVPFGLWVRPAHHILLDYDYEVFQVR